MSDLDFIEQFQQGLKEPLKKQCIWDPARRGPFQDLQELISFATAHEEAYRSQSATAEGESSHKPIQKQSGNKRTATNQDPQESQTSHANQKKKKEFNPNAGVPSQKPGYQPGPRRPFVPTPVYAKDSIEYQYLTKNNLCFHCCCSGHNARRGPVKHTEFKEASRLHIPPGYQPGMRPPGWVPDPEIADVFEALPEKVQKYIQALCTYTVNAWTDQHKLRMLVPAKAGNLDIQILLDSGASKSCASKDLVDIGQWPVLPEDQPSILSSFDSSQQMTSGHVNIPVKMGKYSEIMNLPVANMPQFSIILGQDWLKQHVATLYFAGNLVAKFEDHGLEYQIPAVPVHDICGRVLPSSEITVEELVHTISALSFQHAAKQPEAETFIVRVRTCDDFEIVGAMSSSQADCRDVKDDRVEILKQKYLDVLCTQQPEGLPPHRPTSATIPLVNENLTVFKQMYRFSPADHQEVARQVKDLLQRGLIRPSASPFGSPILFVKRKDGSIRMVVDWRS
jgi:hypothetical protein